VLEMAKLDITSKAGRSENMRRIGSKDTTPELVVRRLVHSMGYRYRLYRPEIPGKPDMVFWGRRKAIFVHGCFWHQHNRCRRASTPKSHTEYWFPKLRGNKERDSRNLRKLEELGWDVLVVWECQLSNLRKVARRVRHFLGS
jgi:DNA mismatch endonuclease (patch repair protein)